MILRTLLVFTFLLVPSYANPISDFVGWLNKSTYRRDLDGEFAQCVYKALVLSPVNGARPTNWAQVVSTLRADTWIGFEQEFLRQSEGERGFKNSIWEKYVFLEPGIRVPKQTWSSGGDLVLLQVRPPSGRTRQYAIWRDQAGSYEIFPFPEAEIQKWFADAARQIPIPLQNLPPATPVDWRPTPEQSVFDRHGVWFGVISGFLATILFATAFLRFRQRLSG